MNRKWLYAVAAPVIALVAASTLVLSRLDQRSVTPNAALEYEDAADPLIRTLGISTP